MRQLLSGLERNLLYLDRLFSYIPIVLVGVSVTYNCCVAGKEQTGGFSNLIVVFTRLLKWHKGKRSAYSSIFHT